MKPQPPPSLLLGLEPVQSCLGVARVMSEQKVTNYSVPVIFEPPCTLQKQYFDQGISFSDTPHTAGLIWTSDPSETGHLYLITHTTLTTDRHPYPCRDSNPQSLPESGLRPTPWTARLPGSTSLRRIDRKDERGSVYLCTKSAVCLIVYRGLWPVLNV